MRIASLILTLIYGIAAVYTLYMAGINLFVYIANIRMGQSESLKTPLLYIACAGVFTTTTYIGYRIWANLPTSLLPKMFFYLPIGLVLLYVLWAILLLISSGGKWN
jgi:hypothetical protein